MLGLAWSLLCLVFGCHVAVTFLTSLSGWLCVCQNGASELGCRRTGQRIHRKLTKKSAPNKPSRKGIMIFLITKWIFFFFHNIALLFPVFIVKVFMVAVHPKGKGGCGAESRPCGACVHGSIDD